MDHLETYYVVRHRELPFSPPYKTYYLNLQTDEWQDTISLQCLDKNRNSLVGGIFHPDNQETLRRPGWLDVYPIPVKISFEVSLDAQLQTNLLLEVTPEGIIQVKIPDLR